MWNSHFATAGKEPPKLHVLPSPYRFIIVPIVQFVLDLSKNNPGRSIIVVIPELVEDRWYEYFLHNQRGAAARMDAAGPRQRLIFTVTAPWYVHRAGQKIRDVARPRFPPLVMAFDQASRFSLARMPHAGAIQLVEPGPHHPGARVSDGGLRNQAAAQRNLADQFARNGPPSERPGCNGRDGSFCSE